MIWRNGMKAECIRDDWAGRWCPPAAPRAGDVVTVSLVIVGGVSGLLPGMPGEFYLGFEEIPLDQEIAGHVCTNISFWAANFRPLAPTMAEDVEAVKRLLTEEFSGDDEYYNPASA